jgi:hypothetical protein
MGEHSIPEITAGELRAISRKLTDYVALHPGEAMRVMAMKINAKVVGYGLIQKRPRRWSTSSLSQRPHGDDDAHSHRAERDDSVCPPSPRSSQPVRPVAHATAFAVSPPLRTAVVARASSRRHPRFLF